MFGPQLSRLSWCGLALVAACGIDSRVVQERAASTQAAGGVAAATAGAGGTIVVSGGAAPPGNMVGTPTGGTGYFPSGGMAPGPTAGFATGGMGAIPSLDCGLQPGHTLPLTVTDVYVPSGYYAMSWMEVWPGPRCSERAPGARGNCTSFTWVPKNLEWVGVQFQYPVNNWTGPGVCIERGATAILFWAKGELNGGLASFDAVGASIQKLALSGVWTQYRIDLAGVDYNRFVPEGGVRGGFSFVLTRELTDFTQKDLYIDGVEWVHEASVPGAGGAGGAGGASDGGADAGGEPGTAGAGGQP